MIGIISTPVGVLIGLALVFDFLNGFHDSANIVATMISSRALSPRQALTITAVAEFAGPFLFGVAVARTIGSEVAAEQALTITLIIAALLAAIIWNLVTWFLGIPSSSSHALVGGIVGGVLVQLGPSGLRMAGLTKILIALFISPLVGMLAGYVMMKMVLFLARGFSPRINWFFKRAQVLTALVLALSHGTNDAQKTMGVIVMGLLASGVLDRFYVPIWVVVISAGAIALGTATGGWRLIRTLGARFYTIRPVHGFTVQLGAATVILGAALLGGPVSTTQVVSSAILGAGSAERLSKVRWRTAGYILITWVLTIPASAALAGLIYWLMRGTRI